MKINDKGLETALAAALLGGQLNKQLIDRLLPKEAEAAPPPRSASEAPPKETTVANDTNGSLRAIAERWAGATQTAAWRLESQSIVDQNRPLLEQLARNIEAVAALPVVMPMAHPALVQDRLFQRGIVGNDRASTATMLSNPDLLQAGRFAGVPPHTQVAATMPVGDKAKTQTSIAVDRSALADDAMRQLSETMDKQWGILHDRGVEGGTNVNTLTRRAYNAHGIAEILGHLQKRDVNDARVLLVTGYETPIEDLLDSSRVKEVVVADLSQGAADLVAKKYQHHPNASKLRLVVADMSGVDKQLQAEALATFMPKAREGALPTSEEVQGYLDRVPASAAPLPFNTATFDAVHAPFVLGALPMAPLTASIVAVREKSGGNWSGLEDGFGLAELSTKSAQAAVLSNTRHVLSEVDRLTKPGGLAITNVWARPVAQASAGQEVRFSDTCVSASALADALGPFQHRFTGNPQPTLTHTVGHILTHEKPVQPPIHRPVVNAWPFEGFPL